jgi:phytanoyl-CoA hydroxylase
MVMDLPEKLSPEQVRQFHDDGFVIVPDVFDPADLEPIRQAMERMIDEEAQRLHAEGKLENLHEELDFNHRVAAIHRDSKENGEAILRAIEGRSGGGVNTREIFDVIVQQQLIDACADLLSTQEVVASSVYRVRPKLPNIGRGNVPWHQDSGYFQEHCDKSMIITCWIPLVDATVENGCMQILPKTHQGEVALHHTGGNQGFFVIRDEDLPDDPRKSIAATCPRGGVVFMTNRTPHCSTPNYSDHVRWSLDLRYQAIDAPNNIGLMPAKIDEGGSPDAEFAEKVQIACYPPDADFVVRSPSDPSAVTTYDEYVQRRQTYERIKGGPVGTNRWPALATAG